MIYDPSVAFPPEPTTIALLITGLITLFLYLVATGKLKSLRESLSFNSLPHNPLKADDPWGSDYGFCSYESHFAFSLGSMVQSLHLDEQNVALKRPTHFAQGRTTAISTSL